MGWLIGRFLLSELEWLLLSLCAFNWRGTNEFKDALLSKEPLYYPAALLALQIYKVEFPLCLFTIWDDCFVAFWLHKRLQFKSGTNSVEWQRAVNPHPWALEAQSTKRGKVGMAVGVKLGWRQMFYTSDRSFTPQILNDLAVEPKECVIYPNLKKRLHL